MTFTPRTLADKRIASLVDAIGRLSDHDRALLFYRLELACCWDCGKDKKPHPLVCEGSPLLVPSQQ